LDNYIGAMKRPSTPGPAVLLGVLLVLGLGPSGAAQVQGIDEQQADAALNATYQQVMASLPPARQQLLRKAERAWLAFCDKSDAAFASAAAHLNFSAEQLRQAAIAAKVDRCNELIHLSGGLRNFVPNVTRVQLNANDAQLNANYQQCLARLDSGDQALLRDAQRAWIVFRDADALANSQGDIQGGPLSAPLLVTSRRNTQLITFYFHRPSVAQAPARPQETPDPSIPDPFERAR
jgi:uncharacterized protein YecT (DUF1311 family)